MIEKGQKIKIHHGTFKGYTGIVLDIDDFEINIEIEVFGRKTPIVVSYADLNLKKFKPITMGFQELLIKFGQEYKKQAPKRYEKFNIGSSDKDISAFLSKHKIEDISNDFYSLYKWKNGLQSIAWFNEFKEDSWYELIPFDSSDHLNSISGMDSLIIMWESILKDCKREGKECYWKKGFLPFISIQHFGHLVIDMVGYFGGTKGQIIFFDYKCDNGYSIRHENIFKWLETQYVLLTNGFLITSPNNYKTHQITNQIIEEINRNYTSQFKKEISRVK